MTCIDPKADLRRELRARRRDLATVMPTAAEMAAERLPLDQLPPFTVAAGYRAQGAELNPWPILRRLAAAGARIAMPVALQVGAPLSFRAWVQDQPLEPDAARVPGPTADAETLIPDLVICPLLAFDAAGFRLGQGGGYYDRTLEGLRERGRLFVIGLAYAGQEVNRVPREAHDQPLDAILTETGYRAIRKDTGCA
jgi:5-formyltetrahydrofolate cyclo-ligase